MSAFAGDFASLVSRLAHVEVASQHQLRRGGGGVKGLDPMDAEKLVRKGFSRYRTDLACPVTPNRDYWAQNVTDVGTHRTTFAICR